MLCLCDYVSNYILYRCPTNGFRYKPTKIQRINGKNMYILKYYYYFDRMV